MEILSYISINLRSKNLFWRKHKTYDDYNSNDNRFDGRCFLEDVEIKLQKRLEEIGQSLSDGQKEIDNMQEYYWENYTEMDEYGYEDYDNQQALLHQVNANNEKLQLKHRFEKMLDAPFFGRVDFMYVEMTNRNRFILESEILLKRTVCSR